MNIRRTSIALVIAAAVASPVAASALTPDAPQIAPVPVTVPAVPVVTAEAIAPVIEADAPVVEIPASVPVDAAAPVPTTAAPAVEPAGLKPQIVNPSAPAIVTSPTGNPNITVDGQPCVNCVTESFTYRDELGHCFESGVKLDLVEVAGDCIDDPKSAPIATDPALMNAEELYFWEAAGHDLASYLHLMNLVRSTR